MRGNLQERMPHRWIVADTEGLRESRGDTETQTLLCADAVRWRDDLKTGDHAEWWSGESAEDFWAWVDEYCAAGKRVILWFHNQSYDLRTLAAFDLLPRLGWELEWCNLDRDVSVVTWRSDHGTLTIADTYTWVPKALAEIGGMVGIPKPRLPRKRDTLDAWHARCRADVEITRAMVLEILDYIKTEHCGNWQPTGAGMGYTLWRHRFMTHKILVHDNADALDAERRAMWAGRAEAWFHGKATAGPFREYDMHMAYCRIAAECDVPVKFWCDDGKPSKRVHEWAMQTWIVLCDVEVTTDVPCVPVSYQGRVIWPVGTFRTTLWQPELDLVVRNGGRYTVLRQFRYNAAPALSEWARWSMGQCARKDNGITPVQQTWVKHQSRALIGRLALRNSTWDEWGANYHGGAGMTTMLDASTGTQHRMMHVGNRTFMETGRSESDSGLPQITGYIQSVCRVRLWDACQAAGIDNVLHVDTDSLIVNAAGHRQLAKAIEGGLPGGWRTKDTWRRIEVIGPRHYLTATRRVLPGVPRSAVDRGDGTFAGEVWESLGVALSHGRSDSVVIRARTWAPKRVDHRRPWTQDTAHRALPVVIDPRPPPLQRPVQGGQVGHSPLQAAHPPPKGPPVANHPRAQRGGDR